MADLSVALQRIQLQLVQQTEQALQLFSPVDRLEYDLAVGTAPDLVRDETPIFSFLRTEDFQPQHAARRIVLYWKTRRQLFQQRWLNRMTLTGMGALTWEEIAFLRTGYLVAFQRVPEQGWLFLWNGDRLQSSTSKPSQITTMRLLFYYGTVFSDDASQLQGVTVIQMIALRAIGLACPAAVSADSWSLLRNALPLKWKQIIVTRASPLQGLASTEDQIALNQQTSEAFLHAPLSFPTGTAKVLVAADTATETRMRLQLYGCSPNLLPEVLGGTFDYSQFEVWLQAQIVVDTAITSTSSTLRSIVGSATPSSGISSATATAVTMAAAAVSGTSSETSRAAMMASKSPSPATAASSSSSKSQQELQRIRQRNARYSRKTYYKRKAKVNLLQDQVRVLEQERTLLRQDCGRLTKLLQQANQLVASSLDQEEPREKEGEGGAEEVEEEGSKEKKKQKKTD